MAGLWFEELEEGMVFDHELSRTVTEADNMWFCNATLNTQPLHIDYHHAAQTEYGKPLVNSLFTLGLVIGMTVTDTTLGTTVANLGMTNTTFPAPVFFGDTLRTRTTMVSRRSRQRGMVRVPMMAGTAQAKPEISGTNACPGSPAARSTRSMS